MNRLRTLSRLQHVATRWLRELGRTQNSFGFSTIGLGILMLVLMLPIVFISESVLVSARQATSNALGQENLRAVDGAMLDVISEIRLDAATAEKGCGVTESDGSAVFYRPQYRPKQANLDLWVKCSVAAVDEEERILDLDAVMGSVDGRSIGKARIRFIDKLGSSSEPGAEMLVCDWQLGKGNANLGDC